MSYLQRADLHEKRKTTITMILAVCNNHPRFAELPESTREGYAVAIERSCYNECVSQCVSEFVLRYWDHTGFLHKYSSIVYKNVANLDTNSSVNSRLKNNSSYLDDILDGKIDIKLCGRLGSIDMCPVASDEERTMLHIRSNIKLLRKYVETQECRNCHSKKIYREEVKTTLGSDELTSFKYTCDSCNKWWIS